MSIDNVRLTKVKKESNSLEYRLIYALVFGSVIVLAFLRRLIPAGMNPWRVAETEQVSPIVEARMAATSTVPYVFQI